MEILRRRHELAPDAARRQFDVVILRAAGKLGLIWSMRLLYGRRHRNHPAITHTARQEGHGRASGQRETSRMLIEADGNRQDAFRRHSRSAGAITLRD
jgi:diacylglycerol kinase family enzyme